MTDSDSKPFWEVLALHEMSNQQWESVCDGCGRCCLQKLEDTDTGKVYFTRISCRLLDLQSCRCGAYENRFDEVPDCTQVKPLTDEKRKWLPQTCAYRLLADGKPLPQWHPLISGVQASVQAAGISVGRLAISEQHIAQDDYEEHVINFYDPDI